MYIINYTKQYIDLLALLGWNKFLKTPLHFGPLQWSAPLMKQNILVAGYRL